MELFLIDVPVPSMGATVNELTIVDIKVQPGARVAKGEKIAELESDKSVFEFEAPCDGVIAEINCRAGDILPSGAPFLRIETADASLRHLEAKADGGRRTVDGGRKTEPAVAASVPVFESKIENPKSKIQWTPRATKLVQEAGLDPATLVDLEATGPGGRVSGDDVARYLAARPALRVSQIPNLKSEITVSAGAETVCIAGLGYAVPKNVMSNREILKEFPGRTEAEIVKLTGIKERRHAEDDESAADLAAIAVQHALAQAGMPVQEIDGIIMATLIPDQPVPSMASKLAKLLGIPHALAFDLNAACSGWLYALEVGRAFICSGTAKKILVVTAELLSRITNPKDK
jgi:pyruvate/2-oxoglutarate dehydrogenase complex dihydrolipoamide acyltransferase (E2) component